MPFPEHCEKKDVSTMSKRRFRLPGVLTKTLQPFCLFSFSSWMVCRISANSALTKSSWALPLA
jgi:hypothetical protein